MNVVTHRMWPVEIIPGQLNRELDQPHHLDDAASPVTPEKVVHHFTGGADTAGHVAVRQKSDDDVTEIYPSRRARLRQNLRCHCIPSTVFARAPSHPARDLHDDHPASPLESRCSKFETALDGIPRRDVPRPPPPTSYALACPRTRKP
jgi:hypothetical protein